MDGTRRATIRDVADLAGVDPAVVSRVLRNDATLRVRLETRRRVLQAARRLRYQPNVHARNLAEGRAGTLGLIIPNYMNPVYAEIVAGAESVASQRGLLLWTASWHGFDADAYRSAVGGGLVDGLLIAGARADQPMEQLLDGTGVPALLVNRRAPGAHRWITLDDERAATVATDHLIALGHRAIGYVDGPPWADTAARRLTGFRAAMERAGLVVEPDHVVRGDYTPSGGKNAIDRMLARAGPLTGLVVANALAAIGAWKSLHEWGLRVPEDVSVVAIHQLPFEEYRVPQMTCVRMPLHELGVRAAELLLDTGPESSIAAVVEGVDLVTGDTTVAPGAGS